MTRKVTLFGSARNLVFNGAEDVICTDTGWVIVLYTDKSFWYRCEDVIRIEEEDE